VARGKDEIVVNHNHDGIDRRGFLKCMAWAGTGTLCVMKGGVLNSYALSALTTEDAAKANGALSFAQIIWASTSRRIRMSWRH